MTDFKTSKQLDIEPWERRALIRTLRFLREARPRRVVDTCSWPRHPDVPAKPKFNMNVPVRPYECGTAFCVGGYAYLFGRLERPLVGGLVRPLTMPERRDICDYVENWRSSALYPLYFPHAPAVGNDWDRLTASQAARAIERFLSGNTSDPWKRMRT